MKETRAYEVRASADPLIIEGTAVVFDQPADMHGYTERIERSALDGVNLDDITLLVKNNSAGACRALIKSHNVLCHIFTSLILIQSEIFAGIIEGNILCDFTERLLVKGIFAVFNEFAEQIAHYPAEVFVSGIGNKGA